MIVLYFVVYGFFTKWICLATGHPAVGAIANAVAFAGAPAAVFPMLSKAAEDVPSLFVAFASHLNGSNDFSVRQCRNRQCGLWKNTE